VALSLLCPPHCCCCTFLQALRFLLSLVLIYLSVRWPPRFIYSFTVPSQDCWSCLNSFLFFIFSLSQLCGGFLALCGNLWSSSSIQQIFCSNHSTCKCFFLICLWEKVKATSYSFNISIPPPVCVFFSCSL